MTVEGCLQDQLTCDSQFSASSFSSASISILLCLAHVYHATTAGWIPGGLVKVRQLSKIKSSQINKKLTNQPTNQPINRINNLSDIVLTSLFICCVLWWRYVVLYARCDDGREGRGRRTRDFLPKLPFGTCSLRQSSPTSCRWLIIIIFSFSSLCTSCVFTCVVLSHCTDFILLL